MRSSPRTSCDLAPPPHQDGSGWSAGQCLRRMPSPHLLALGSSAPRQCSLARLPPSRPPQRPQVVHPQAQSAVALAALLERGACEQGAGRVWPLQPEAWRRVEVQAESRVAERGQIMSWLARLFHIHDWRCTSWGQEYASRDCWKCDESQRRWRDGPWEPDRHDTKHTGIQRRAKELHPDACIEIA